MNKHCNKVSYSEALKVNAILHKLNQDLRDYIYKIDEDLYMIKHPFVTTLLVGDIDVVNKLYVRKMAIVGNALNKRDYEKAVSFIEKPFRADYLNLMKTSISGLNLLKLIKCVWIDSEYINMKTWEEIFVYIQESGLSLYEAMNKNEKKTLEDLFKDNEKIIVYRGYSSTHNNKKGYSFTLEQKLAQWFSTRFETDKEPEIFEIEIKKSDVMAYFSHEKEILVRI